MSTRKEKLYSFQINNYYSLDLNMLEEIRDQVMEELDEIQVDFEEQHENIEILNRCIRGETLLKKIDELIILNQGIISEKVQEMIKSATDSYKGNLSVIIRRSFLTEDDMSDITDEVTEKLAKEIEELLFQINKEKVEWFCSTYEFGCGAMLDKYMSNATIMILKFWQRCKTNHTTKVWEKWANAFLSRDVALIRSYGEED